LLRVAVSRSIVVPPFIVAQVPDDPQPLDRIREESGGALGCCERRTRSDAAGREYESTQGEVGRAVATVRRANSSPIPSK
jgi:hypothetical protein